MQDALAKGRPGHWRVTKLGTVRTIIDGPCVGPGTERQGLEQQVRRGEVLLDQYTFVEAFIRFGNQLQLHRRCYQTPIIEVN